MVDAGMRELWITGAMHNRVRMVVGSFLVKNLLLHWHHKILIIGKKLHLKYLKVKVKR